MSRKEFSVIVPESVFPKPSAREMSAAYILLDYFKTDIKFVPRSNQKTPDFSYQQHTLGAKDANRHRKYNIQHLLHSAIQQSKNIIVDARYSKMHLSRIVSELRHHSTLTTKGIKNLIVITKSKKILVIV